MLSLQIRSRRYDALALSLAATLFALGYVCLAAWGWGGWRPLLASYYRVGVCAALIVLAGITPFCGCNLNLGRRSHDGNDWIFSILLINGLAMGWLSAVTDRHNFWTIDGNVARCAGLSIFLIGCALRVGTMLVLGPRFSVWVAVQADHRLETTGFYRFLRHPSYTGAVLTLFGWALTFRSALGLLLAATMVVPLLSRMAAEENLLIAEFGEEYVNYRGRTWRLIPLIY